MSPSLQVSDPTELGLDPDRLARIDRFIAERYIDSGRFPGFSLLISRGGSIGHLSFRGHAREGGDSPMAEDTLVRIYSMSKPITSVALLSLYEEGRFKLDQPVSSFIPSFADLRVFGDGTAANHTVKFPEREMTVHDLLTHTSGLTYGFMGRHPVDGLYRRAGLEGLKLDEYVEALAGIPLLFSPGTEWSYSVATDVIGRLIEVISGQDFDVFLSERFFQPLGMVDTGFWVEDGRAHRLAANYAVPELSPFPLPPGADGDTKVVIDAADQDSPYRHKPTFLSGGGGLVSTIGDYHRFTQMLLRGGELDGTRVLGRKTIEYATTNHLPGGQDLASMGQPVFSETRYDGVGFGLGFSVVIDPAASQVLSSAGEFAWGGAASTLFWVDPAEELTVIGLTQLMPSSAYPIRQELKALVYSALTE